MNFFISDALAAAPAVSGNSLTSFLPLIAIFVAFYFLLIRPQQKRTKEHKAMIENLQKGDEVVNAGGILGKIISVNDNFINMEIAKELTVSVQKTQITQLMPKGTIKSAK